MTIADCIRNNDINGLSECIKEQILTIYKKYNKGFVTDDELRKAILNIYLNSDLRHFLDLNIGKAAYAEGEILIEGYYSWKEGKSYEENLHCIEASRFESVLEYYKVIDKLHYPITFFSTIDPLIEIPDFITDYEKDDKFKPYINANRMRIDMMETELKIIVDELLASNGVKNPGVKLGVFM